MPLLALFLGAQRSRLFLIALVVLALASSGCVEFEKETIVAVVDPENNGARILLVYEALHSDANQGNQSGLASDLAELDQLFKVRESFYCGHPLLRVDLQEAKTPVFPKKSDDLNEKLRVLLCEHVSIRTAGFFVSRQGKLCGFQTLRVRHLRKFVRGLNEWMSELFAAQIKDARGDPKKFGREWDLKSMLAMEQAAKDHFPWLRVEPGRISFTLLGSQDFLIRIKRDVLSPLVTQEPANDKTGPALPKAEEILKRNKDLERGLRLLSESALSLDHRRDRMTFSLGLGDGEPIRLAADYGVLGPRPCDGRLLDHARKVSGDLRRNVDVETLITEFLHPAEN